MDDSMRMLFIHVDEDAFGNNNCWLGEIEVGGPKFVLKFTHLTQIRSNQVVIARMQIAMLTLNRLNFHV